MSELKANLDEIELLIGSMKTCKSAIETSVSTINDPSKSEGIMLTEYIDRIRKISNLLSDYKKMLDKDISDISISTGKIQEMDKQMENLSKSC